MRKIQIHRRLGIRLLLFLILASPIGIVPVKAHDTRIDAIDRFDMKLSDLTIDADQIQFALNLSGNGVESEEECLESYRDGVREGESGDDRLCRTVRQEFSFFNGVIPEDAAVIKTTLTFDDDSYFKIYPTHFDSNISERVWTRYGYKAKFNFYNPDAIKFDDYGHESTDTDILRGRPTKDSLGIYLTDFHWGVYQIAIGINYRTDYFNPFLATVPIKSEDDIFFQGLAGLEIVDGISGGASGGPTVADLIESGETDILQDLPENPVIDSPIIFTFNDRQFGNGYRYTSDQETPLRIDLCLAAPNVVVTYRTGQGGIGNWIGTIDNHTCIQYAKVLK